MFTCNSIDKGARTALPHLCPTLLIKTAVTKIVHVPDPYFGPAMRLALTVLLG